MWVDCGLRKAFLGGALNVTLQANDIFASMRNSFINYGEIMTFDKWNYNDSRQVRLRFLIVSMLHVANIKVQVPVRMRSKIMKTVYIVLIK